MFTILIFVLFLHSGCATKSELREVESSSKELILQIEQDRARTERDLAVANLKYQNANDKDKAAMQDELVRMQAKLNSLDKIAADARVAREGVETLLNQSDRQREAFDEALRRFKAAEDSYRAYQQQPRY